MTMRKVLVVPLLLCAAFLAGAQQTAPITQWTPPDVLSSQTAAAVALVSYKASLETEINSIATMVNSLSAQVALLQQPANALTPTTITIPADAYSSISGTGGPNKELGVC